MVTYCSRYLTGDLSQLEITPGLFLGPQEAAFMVRELRDRGVTHVLDVAGLSYHRGDSLIYRSIEIEDVCGEDIMCHFGETNLYIERAIYGKGSTSEGKEQHQGGVLVHCAAGISRSATVVIAYLMWKHGYNLDDAFLMVKTKRAVIDPNVGFMRQLKIYEGTLAERNSLL